MVRRLIVIALCFAPLTALGQGAGANLWSHIEDSKRKGELGDLSRALDQAAASLRERLATGALDGSSAEARAENGRIAGLRQWLTPQMPYFEALSQGAEAVEGRSRNLELWAASPDVLGGYGRILVELEKTEGLAASFRGAFPGAGESRALRRLAAARKNLAEARQRAVANWLHAAGERLDRAAAEGTLSVDARRQLALIDLVDPGNGLGRDLQARALRLRTERQPVPEAQRAFPAAGLAQYRELEPLLRTALFRLDPSVGAERLAVTEDLATWVDPQTLTEHQLVAGYVLRRFGEGCKLAHVTFRRARGEGAAYGPWAVADVDPLYDLPCP